MRNMIAIAAILLGLAVLTRLPSCSSPALPAELRVELAELIQTEGLPYGPITSGFNTALLTQGDLDQLLRGAAEGGTPAMVRWLLERKANPHMPDRQGRTPLHLAAKQKAGESAAMLLEKKADPNARDHEGRTPLHYAAQESPATTAALLKAGAKADIRDDKGNSALILSRCAACVEALLATGADAGIQDKEGRTPLHLAVKRRDVPMVELLLGKGVSLEAADARGQTALHYAAAEGYGKTVEILLEKGANPESRDAGGALPRDLAARGGHRFIVQMLGGSDAEAAQE